jgi:hypothetical protein
MLIDMVSELSEAIPSLDRVYAKTLVRRAYQVVRDSNLWSWQLQQGGFSTPQLTDAGSISIPGGIGTSLIVGDLTATMTWNALPLYFAPPFQQIRATGYSIYSIISQTGNGSIAYATIFSAGSGQTPGTYTYPILDSTGPGVGGSVQIVVDATGVVLLTPVILAGGSGYLSPYIVFSQGGVPAVFTFSQFAVLTLDRPFVDPLPNYTGVGYELFQAYIAAPVGFKRFLNVADMFNCYALDVWTSRRTADMIDPARLYTSNPICMFGLGTDQRGMGTTTPSSTLGQQMFELYPNPSTAISYMTYYVSNGPDLVNNSDELPYPITQDVVLEKAKTYAYEWAEGRKDVMLSKGSGANYLMLKKDAEATFLTRLKTLRLIDKDAVDAFNINMNAFMGGFRMPFFNSRSMRANMGLGF